MRVPSTHARDAEPPVRPGELLAGKYRVQRVIATGGMGTVVQAHHEQLRQSVAIKLMLAESRSDALLVQRFLREASTAAQLRTEHVARVLDVGQLANGSPFMVMELLEGSDLGSLLRAKGRLGIEEAVGYVMQACEAVAEAHAIRIVHRDLKPSNLFLTRRVNGSALVKVLDFGISKWERANTLSPRLTATSAVIGSPLYMSPEQMREAHAVDHRADIWALGVVLHELLAGQPPFHAPHVSEVAAMVLRDPAPALRASRPDVPVALERAVLRCLEKDPARRFPSVAELVRELAPFAGERVFDPFDTVSTVARRGAALEDTVAAPTGSLAPAGASYGSHGSPVVAATTFRDASPPAGLDLAPPPPTATAADINAYLMSTQRGDGAPAGFPVRLLLVAVLIAVLGGLFAAVLYDKHSKPVEHRPPTPEEAIRRIAH